ncbi:hypothetical protein MLD38_000190 [Melastoma candidum]|uniref:Uncharacterized protein n=1 Tax=Melastoma candidum TaxID=119954 RepID=A0ACB9SAV7_9MYRT|nr:hypothetical protein MLD38_000190 [Melastoma candidum]
MLIRFSSLSHVALTTTPELPHCPSGLQKEKWDRNRRRDRSGSIGKLEKGRWCWEGRNRASSRSYSYSALVGDSEDKSMGLENKKVWIWTENKAVMMTAVERGWNTFLFSPENQHLALEWSSIALINPLFVEEGCIFDGEKHGVATISHVSTPEEVLMIQSEDGGPVQHLVVELLDWQVIPAENLVAAFQGSQKTVLAVSTSPGEARVFLEALEHGLGGVVLKAEDVDAVLGLKDYFDRRYEVRDLLELKKGVITQVRAVGMGDRACVDLCCLMKPGEGLLVGSFARGLFLVHSECMESNYISSRPFRVNAGPVHAYVAVPGGRTCYLSELKAGQEVLVVDQKGHQRTAIVGRVKIETRPLLLVEAKLSSDPSMHYSIFLQNAETVALVPSPQGERGGGETTSSLPLTTLKVGDEVVIRTQGGARHTGIQIEEFIVEK